MKHVMMSILTALGLGTSSCARQESVTSVDANHFENAIHANSVQLIDVRSANEYAEGHIAHAANIDALQNDFLAKAQRSLSKKKPAYVYCRSGKRSMMAANKLAKAGYKVINLRGGILEWMDAGKPVNR
ncbi:rhodanese [Prevotella sp. S7-1-8]|jgi:hypothetical protein|uniref:rhodanese-like domain-containing protein n=1 Tax=Prevotella sp. S7-1-8 TaxID=1284775 RepID=UPI00050F3AAE|nr:rhodanese-like domain-containing protein [Prevotella sp. S7-1-8]KGF18635.1 rhodanese [Prevotella sp. S7-1-8]